MGWFWRFLVTHADRSQAAQECGSVVGQVRPGPAVTWSHAVGATKRVAVDPSPHESNRGQRWAVGTRRWFALAAMYTIHR